MPVGVLRFRLPEEDDEFRTAQNGIHYRIALQEIDNFCRNKLKYEEHAKEIEDIYQEIRDQLRLLLGDIEL